MEEQRQLIEGREVNMGGKPFIIPALNFARLKKLKAELELINFVDLTQGLSDTYYEACITIIHTALTRNYPDLTREAIEELVDLRNLPVIMEAIMGQSGLVRTAGEPGPGMEAAVNP